MKISDIFEGYGYTGWNRGGYVGPKTKEAETPDEWQERFLSSSPRERKRMEMQQELAHEDNFTYDEEDDDQDPIYVKVPYALKDEAKRAGLSWSPTKKSWYYNKDMNKRGEIDMNAVLRFQNSKPTPRTSSTGGKIFLNVPYREKDEAKQFGARWDPQNKKWYFQGSELPEELSRWKAS